MAEEEITIDKRKVIADIVEDAYTKSYKMRFVGPGSVEATLPKPIVEREARKVGLSVEEFIEQYQVEYLFNDFGGAFLRFRKAEEKPEPSQ